MGVVEWFAYNLACIGTFYDGCGAMMHSKCRHYSKAIVTHALTSTTAISIVQTVYMSIVYTLLLRLKTVKRVYKQLETMEKTLCFTLSIAV